MTTRIVQFSTGAGSAEVAFRAHATGDPVVLLTADTMVEDDDNWRFAYQCVEQMPGVQWIILANGRTPMQVGRDHRCVPNNRMAVCSRILKRELLRDFMDANYDPADSIVCMGFDWTEEHRYTASVSRVTCAKCRKANAKHCDEHRLIDCDARPVKPDSDRYCPEPITEAHVHPWAPWAVDAPLMHPPLLEKWDVLGRLRGRGIEPPRLYAQGFSHANCGGACVRGGQADWELLLRVNRPRYLEWEAEEHETRVMLGKNVSILRDRTNSDRRTHGRPLSLAAFRERLDSQPELFDTEEWGACGCTDE